jgi:flagellar protein FlaJ
MIDDIKQNIEHEITLAQQIETLITLQDKSGDEEITMLKDALQSARARMKLINDALPEMVKSVSLVKQLGSTPKPLGIERVTVKKLDQRVAIRSQDKDSFLQQLNISEKLLEKIRKRRDTSSDLGEDYSRSSPYARLSNAVFLKYAKNSMAKGEFKDLALDLRKANLNVLTASYISILLFTTLLAGIIGVMLGIFLWFFSVSINAPFILPNQMEILQRIAVAFGGLVVPPILVFGALYIYPSVERRSIASRIDSELPFVVIHMGSISGSGVEPTQIFKIVGLSKEYPYTRGEIRKVINQINVYGYDLITALKNIAKLTPSQRLSELLGGMASSITSGGDMQIFFEKRAETLLFNYRIERENFTKVAETFMDLYISIVIATPMILLLLLVMISVSGISVGLGVNQMTLLIIFIVGIVNIIFLWILSIRQPNY